MSQAIIGAGGALLCVVIGHVLTRWWQAKQWMREQKLIEFRELVTALTASMHPYQTYVVSNAALMSDLGIRVQESLRYAEQVISDRIFIRSEMKKLRVAERFFSTRGDFSNDNDLIPAEDASTNLLTT
jgi:hypothetical protein